MSDTALDIGGRKMPVPFVILIQTPVKRVVCDMHVRRVLLPGGVATRTSCRIKVLLH